MAEYITKDQVIEWVRPYGHMDEGIQFSQLKADVIQMTAADVAPVVHGRWIEHKPFEGHRVNECIECSECNTWFGHDCYAKTNYCPNCGARMDGDADEASESV